MELSSKAFFDTIIRQHENKKPFVVYNKPNIGKISGLLQLDDDIYYTGNYTKKGFVFVPFDSKKEGVLIPEEHSSKIECNCDFENISESFDEVSLPNEGRKEKKHIALVERAVSTIKHTELRKVVLSRTKEVNLSSFDFASVFKRLVLQYPNAFCYVWYHPKVGLWLGATPEVLLSIKNNQFATMALAGTQKYNGLMDVVWGKKEKVEQELVTESILDKLKNISSRVETSVVKTIKAGSLLHLKTDITGIANTDNVKEIVACLHPTPAVCGLPRTMAKDFILKEEGYDRAYYTGFLGELNHQNGDEKSTSFFVNLRCMEYKKGKLILYVGGGITEDSDAQLEWMETESKSHTMLDVLLK